MKPARGDTWLVIGVVALCLAPHLASRPAWTGPAVAALLALRAVLARRAAALPGRWPLLALLLAGAGASWLSHGTLVGREAGITMAVLLLALKTLEWRTRRDTFVGVFLGLFVVMAWFFADQSALTALWALVACTGLLGLLVLAHLPQGRPSMRCSLGVTA